MSASSAVVKTFVTDPISKAVLPSSNAFDPVVPAVTILAGFPFSRVATTMPMPGFDASRCCSVAFTAESLGQLCAESAPETKTTELNRATDRSRSFFEIIGWNWR